MTPEERLEYIRKTYESGGWDQALSRAYDMILNAIDQERLRCAKIAEEYQFYSPLQNPSDIDIGWKRAAAQIARRIRES